MPPIPQPVNGHVVDLGQMKQAAQAREQFEEQREQMTRQILTQAGLQCPCGERIRAIPTLFFTVAEAMIPTEQGPQPGLNLQVHTCCSRDCSAALIVQQTAIARRDGVAGRVAWLDERRAAILAVRGE